MPSVVINVNDPSGGMDNPVNVTVSTLGNNVTLRDAINAANNTSATSGDSYVINLPAGNTITFTSPVNNTTITSNNTVQNQNWYGPNALPAITSNITIEGNGDTLKVSGTNMRFFYVSGGPRLTGGAMSLGTLELDNLTLTGGTAQGGNGGGGGLGAGGAIFNQGNLTLNGDTLTNNRAIGGTGVRFGAGGGMGSDGDSSGNGGGFGGNFSITGGPTSGSGSKSGGGGGAGFQSSDNGRNALPEFGPGGGGGVGGFGSGAGGDGGGGASVGSGSLEGQPITGGGDGGGFGAGGGLPAGTGLRVGGGGGIGGGGAANLVGGGGGFGGGGGSSGFDRFGGFGGFGGGGGGAEGIAGGGGGGFGGGAGTSTDDAGGGGAGMGGGIFTMFGSLTVINSTLAGNIAQGGNGSDGNLTGAQGGSGYGGAIFNLDGNVTLTYATIAINSVLPGTGGNSTVPGFSGGISGNADGSGVYNLAYGNTLSGQANTAVLTLNNSVIGQNNYYGLSHDLVNDSENGKNTNAAQVDGSSSVVQGGAIQTGNGTNLVAKGAISVTSAPNLATTLANNGGLTQTLAPNSDSPVLGAGNDSLSGLPGVDQRGVSRPSSTSSIKPDDGAFQTQSTTTTQIATASVSSTYNSTTPQTVTLSASVAGGNGGTINEGSVTFTVSNTSLTATGLVSNGTATATLTLPAGFAARNYSFSASYADASNASYGPSTTATTGTLSVNSATVTTTPLNIASPISSKGTRTVTLAANITSANGGIVNEGSVTFTIIVPNGTNLTGTGSVSNGTATASVALPSDFSAGTYVYITSYDDKKNTASGIPNYAANSSAATVDPPDGSGTATLTVIGSTTSSGAATPPVSPPRVSGPVGNLSLFAIGFGPTGIDLFEIDSQGNVFAQALFGGGLQLVDTSLRLSLALMNDEGLMALLAGSNGRNYFIDVFDPLLPSIEAAVLPALHP